MPFHLLRRIQRGSEGDLGQEGMNHSKEPNTSKGLCTSYVPAIVEYLGGKLGIVWGGKQCIECDSILLMFGSKYASLPDQLCMVRGQNLDNFLQEVQLGRTDWAPRFPPRRYIP